MRVSLETSLGSFTSQHLHCLYYSCLSVSELVSSSVLVLDTKTRRTSSHEYEISIKLAWNPNINEFCSGLYIWLNHLNCYQLNATERLILCLDTVPLSSVIFLNYILFCVACLFQILLRFFTYFYLWASSLSNMHSVFPSTCKGIVALAAASPWWPNGRPVDWFPVLTLGQSVDIPRG